MRVCIVDFSYLLYQSAFAFKSLFALAPNGQGGHSSIFTGHVYGTLNTVLRLSQEFDRVLLALDSWSEKKSKFSVYKSGRKHSGYNPFNDLINILSLATKVDNVWYVRMDGLEADDVISSYIRYHKSVDSSIELYVYGVDNDQLQTDADFTMFSSWRSGRIVPLDREGYIEKKYGYRLKFLPIWDKVLRGDRSDNIPNIVPRFNKSTLISIILDNKDHQNCDNFMLYLRDNYRILFSRYEDFERKVQDNYYLVKPLYRTLDYFIPEKMYVECRDKYIELLDRYSLESFRELY